MPPKKLIIVKPLSFSEALAKTADASNDRKVVVEKAIAHKKFAAIFAAIDAGLLDWNETYDDGKTSLFMLLEPHLAIDSEYRDRLFELEFARTGIIYYEAIARGIHPLTAKLFNDLASSEAITTTRGDDSSDDEHEAPSFAQTSLHQAWKDFNKKALFRCTKSFYSFVVHHIGINLLHSREIHDAYWHSLATTLPAKESYKDFFERIKSNLKNKLITLLLELKIGWSLFEHEGNAVIDPILDGISHQLAKREHLKNNYHGSVELFELLHHKLNQFFKAKGKKQLDNAYAKRQFRDMSNYEARKAIFRPLLRPAARLIMRTQTDFFSQLLLSLRSSKRGGLHLRDHGLASADDIRPIIYSMNGYDVCEVQILCKGTDRSRRDEVKHFGSYTDIVARIAHFGMDKKVTEFAKLLRDILTFTSPLSSVKTEDPLKQDDFMEFAHELALLIGGTEGIRNPSAFVHTMMLLDLVEAKQKNYETWKEALIDRMPMAIAISDDSESGRTVVSAARYLHHHYSPYQGSYRYPGKLPPGTEGTRAPVQEAKVNELIDRENALTQDWLKWKMGLSVLPTMEASQKKQIDLIITACQTWFPGIVAIPRPTTKTLFCDVLTAEADVLLVKAPGAA